MDPMWVDILDRINMLVDMIFVLPEPKFLWIQIDILPLGCGRPGDVDGSQQDRLRIQTEIYHHVDKST